MEKAEVLRQILKTEDRTIKLNDGPIAIFFINKDRKTWCLWSGETEAQRQEQWKTLRALKEIGYQSETEAFDWFHSLIHSN